MFALGRCSLFTGDSFSYCSRMSRSQFVLSCKCIVTLHARFFLKTASDLSGRCTDERVFPASNFDVA